MHVEAIKSDIITGEDQVMNALKKALQDIGIPENSVLVITSKVVAIDQGRTKKVATEEAFTELVHQESDEFYGGKHVHLTKKNNIFTPWAGIDRSNTPDGNAILWPENPFKMAEKYQKQLKQELNLKHLGILISDSICTPLRKGVTAIALGYAGFQGVNDLRGKPDLFKKKLEVSQQNMADMLAAAAHLVMGESNEQTPFGLIQNAPITFTNEPPNPTEPTILQEDCLFNPLYND